MSIHVNSLTVDSHDIEAQARFWAEALSWVVVREADDEILIAPGTDPAEFPGAIPISFLVSDDTKTVKNRLHLDLVPDDQAAEVTRLEALGATRVDIGQGDVRWVVMADPEGNEFCVLHSYQG